MTPEQEALREKVAIALYESAHAIDTMPSDPWEGPEWPEEKAAFRKHASAAIAVVLKEAARVAGAMMIGGSDGFPVVNDPYISDAICSEILSLIPQEEGK